MIRAIRYVMNGSTAEGYKVVRFWDNVHRGMPNEGIGVRKVKERESIDRKILVVDDDPSIGKLLAGAIKTEGYQYKGDKRKS